MCLDALNLLGLTKKGIIKTTLSVYDTRKIDLLGNKFSYLFYGIFTRVFLSEFNQLFVEEGGLSKIYWIIFK